MIEENMLRGSLVSSNEAKGALGFKGERGYSAYEIAVQNGYEGTEQEWINHFGLDLSGYVQTSDVVDNLTSTETTHPLSAKQGKVLNDSKINTSDIVDNLTTNSSTKVLSAKQGKILNDCNSYSTTEALCGTWLGNDNYRVTKNIGSLPNNGRKMVDFTGIIPSGVICTRIFGTAERVSSSTYDYVNLESLTSLLMYRSSANTLYIDTTSDRSAWTGIVTIEYKKTTD